MEKTYEKIYKAIEEVMGEAKRIVRKFKVRSRIDRKAFERLLDSYFSLRDSISQCLKRMPPYLALEVGRTLGQTEVIIAILSKGIRNDRKIVRKRG